MSANQTYLTTTNELNSIANAIRTKGGTSATLEYPQGFIDAIDDIQTGGGVTPPSEGIIATEYHTTTQSAGSYNFNGMPSKAKLYGSDVYLPGGLWFGGTGATGNTKEQVGYFGFITELDVSEYTGTCVSIPSGYMEYTGYLPKLLIPQSIFNTVQYIYGNAFRDCGRYVSTYNGTISLELPAIQTIGSYAFSHVHSLKDITIGANITTISANAFRYMPYTDSITILGTPTSIGANAFGGNKSGAVLNVVWSEGAVSGAPWGFTGTINYDYVPSQS